MRVARLHAVGDIRLSEVPVPAPEPGMSLVRVTAVGICGSDLHWWGEAGIGDATLVAPLVLGHEAAGVIVEGPRTIPPSLAVPAGRVATATATFAAVPYSPGTAARTGPCETS